MWLLLCEDNDEASEWAYRGLLERDLVPIELLTASALAGIRHWVHRLTASGVEVEVTLADGRTLPMNRVRGALNRLVVAWNPAFVRAPAADREYAVQEFYAFFTSWLHALPGAVLNRPGPLGLAGRWRHDSEWMVLAATAGLPTAPYFMPEALDKPQTGCCPDRTMTVIVVDKEVFGDSTEGPLSEGCRRLAELSATPLLGVDFVADTVGEWTFAGATAYPNLRLGGESLLDALARTLSREPAGVR